MAMIKPPRKPLSNLKINFEAAWEELLKGLHILGEIYDEEGKCVEQTIRDKMVELEEKHKNMVTLKQRSNPEIVDYCIKKSVEAQMENIYLKKKLKEKYQGPKIPMERYDNGMFKDAKRQWKALPETAGKSEIYCKDRVCPSPKRRFVIIDETVKNPESKLFHIHLVTITGDSIEFNLNMKVTEKKFEYYKSAFNKGENISWHGLKMRIVELNYNYPESDYAKEGMTFRYLRRTKDEMDSRFSEHL